MHRKFIPIFFLIFCLPIYGRAFEKNAIQDLSIVCDTQIIYEDDNQTVTARKNAVFRGKGFALHADLINWNRSTSEILASGSVILNAPDSRLLADTLWLKLSNGHIKGHGIMGIYDKQFFQTKSLEKNATSWTLTDARFYFAEPELFTPNISSESFYLDENSSQLKLIDSKINLGHVPIFHLPNISTNSLGSFINTPSSRIRLRTGHDSLNGWYLEKGLKYANHSLSREIKMTFYQERGILISPSFKWENKSNYYPTKFSITSGWISDQGNDLGNDINLQTIGKNRGYAKLTFTSRPKENIHISTVGEWEKDSEVLHDFRREEFYRSSWNQNHAELTYEGNGYSISVGSEWQMNSHEATRESLPLIGIEYGPIRWGGGFHTGSVNYGRLTNRNYLGDKNGSIDRANIGYKIEKPLRLMTGITLTPSLAVRHQAYKTNASTTNRLFGEYGVDLHTTMHQYYAINSSTWRMKDALHLTRFSLAYRQTELISGVRDLPFTNVSEQNGYDLNLDSLDLLDDLDHDNLKERKILRIGWENLFFTKWKKNTRKIITSRIFYDLCNSLNSSPDSESFLYTQTSFYPSELISFFHSAKIHASSGETFRNSFGLKIQDGRFQGVELSLVDYKDIGPYSQLIYSCRINEKTLIHTQMEQNLENNSLAGWMVNLDYKISKSWFFNFSIREKRETKKGNFTEANFGVSLLDF